jgi:hypothetical protein
VKLILPLSVVLPRKKKADKVFVLNLNIYRNANFHILNQAKILYKEWLYNNLPTEAQDYPDPPYRFIYTVFPANNRKFDIGNVHPIIAKFAEDAFQELGFIPDDSCRIIKEVIYRIGAVDKLNPRCELVIETFKEV